MALPTAPFAPETAAARRALAAPLPLRQRLTWAEALRRLAVARRADWLAAVEADVGRAPAEVLATDLLPTAAACRFLTHEAEAILASRRVGRAPVWLMGARGHVHRRPRGVVGVIGTWNYPVFLNAVPILQALVTGNAVLWKPSELTPRTAAVTAELFAAAGVPPGWLTTLPATREGGPALAEADIDFIHFTGSDAVGRRLAARLGERLVPSTLELSGCDALIVLPDADLTLAARCAWYGATLNRGQTCLATRRVFVPAGQLAAFRAALEPLIQASAAAPLVAEGQAAQAERLLAEARGRGCEVVCAPAGAGVAPAAVFGATPGLALCREASFAPLVAVLSYLDEADLLAQEAACPFALAAAVFTADAAAARRLAARLRVGTVLVNDVIAATAHPATPFGGAGASGWGVTQGAEGLLAFTTPQVVLERPGRFRPHVDAGLAPSAAQADVVEGLFLLTHGPGGARAGAG